MPQPDPPTLLIVNDNPAQLRESEEYYRNLFEEACDGIATLSLDGCITNVNKTSMHMLGWSRDELVGKPVTQFLTPTSTMLIEDRSRKAQQGESVAPTFELELVRKDEDVVPVECQLRYIRDKAGKPTGLHATCRDLSAKKERERQRTEFIAMLSHDIKNPLGVILGYTDLLLEEMGEQGRAEEKGVLERIRINAFTVHSLVVNYLNFSKIEAGQLTLTKESLLLNDVVQLVGQRYEIEARRRNIVLTFALQPDLPQILGDPLALERVVTNLLHNALKFTPESGCVTLRTCADDGAIVVPVEDTGPGIAEAALSDLFQKFRRGTKNGYHEGMGLGMFISKELVEAHGGHIDVKSTLGEGSCFSVCLPLGSVTPTVGAPENRASTRMVIAEKRSA